LETMNKKRESIKNIIFELQKKKNALDASQISQKEKEKSMKISQKENKTNHSNSTSNDSKSDKRSIKDEENCSLKAT
jgi:hypothetical protein